MCSYCQIVKFYLLLHFHTFCKNLVNLGGLDTGQHCCKRFMIVENSCVADCTATNNAEIVICADTCLLISSTLFACLCRCYGFWTRPKQNFSFWEQNNRCTYFPGLLSFIVVNLWHYIWLLSFQIMLRPFASLLNFKYLTWNHMLQILLASQANRLYYSIFTHNWCHICDTAQNHL